MPTNFTDPPKTINPNDPALSGDWDIYVRDNTKYLARPPIGKYVLAGTPPWLPPAPTAGSDAQVLSNTNYRFVPWTPANGGDPWGMLGVSPNSNLDIIPTVGGWYWIYAQLSWAGSGAGNTPGHRRADIFVNGATTENSLESCVDSIYPTTARIGTMANVVAGQKINIAVNYLSTVTGTSTPVGVPIATAALSVAWRSF